MENKIKYEDIMNVVNGANVSLEHKKNILGLDDINMDVLNIVDDFARKCNIKWDNVNKTILSDVYNEVYIHMSRPQEEVTNKDNLFIKLNELMPKEVARFVGNAISKAYQKENLCEAGVDLKELKVLSEYFMNTFDKNDEVSTSLAHSLLAYMNVKCSKELKETLVYACVYLRDNEDFKSYVIDLVSPLYNAVMDDYLESLVLCVNSELNSDKFKYAFTYTHAQLAKFINNELGYSELVSLYIAGILLKTSKLTNDNRYTCVFNDNINFNRDGLIIKALATHAFTEYFLKLRFKEFMCNR